jgi:cell division protease FtsH
MLDKIKKIFRAGPFNVLIFVSGFLLLLTFLSWLIDSSSVPQVLSHSEFTKVLDKGIVKKVKIDDNRVYGKFTDGKSFEAAVHMTDKIWDTMNAKNIDVIVAHDNNGYDGWYIIGALVVIIVGIVIWIIIKKTKNGGGSSVFSYGKSRFKRNIPGEVTTMFKDIAGAGAAKEALSDIIDFLKNPEKFKKLGARIPKGVLLAGEPGNGKTLLARAVAGEANCTFISISGSDFIEVFVGVGAARIRDLFGQARKTIPCILFIDEIDAIGRSRGTGTGGGHDEREQTLNQLLSEMDGFDQYTQPLVIIAATNMPEILDKALLRPGRFDRVVYVPYPDFNSRLELFKIYTNHLPISSDIDFEKIAGLTQGLSGADLENLVNMAALRASKEQREKITTDDFDKSHKDLINSKKDIQTYGSDNTKEFFPLQVKTRFSDIAGLEDAKEDLIEIVDFLKTPEKYSEIGAKVPRGVLLSGDPGNGKTLLARAVAGEASVPFFYASGSQFVQKYVGVGAERIRELFNQARKHAPSIIFIDELDSIGKRNVDNDGGNREYNQTVNQLLTEMDGFIQNEVPVIVIAATNLKNGIDDALKRPGRFSRHIYVPYPNLKARLKILNVHSIGKKFAEKFDMEAIAKGTSGFSGAAIENLLNEAAIISVSRGRSEISMDEIEEAKDRILLGKKNAGLTQKPGELEKTSYHEAGHAMLSLLQPEYPYQFHKVTILARGGALGVSHSLPIDDQTGFSKESMEAMICVSLGGRAAEQVIFNHIHTGASSDFRNATKIAQEMVMIYGMDENIGMVSYLERRKISSETKREIDLAIKSILDICYKKAVSMLTKNKAKLKKLAKELLEKETLDSEAVKNILKIK